MTGTEYLFQIIIALEGCIKDYERMEQEIADLEELANNPKVFNDVREGFRKQAEAKRLYGFEQIRNGARYCIQKNTDLYASENANDAELLALLDDVPCMAEKIIGAVGTDEAKAMFESIFGVKVQLIVMTDIISDWGSVNHD